MSEEREARASSLDAGREELREMAAAAGRLAAEYFEGVAARRVFPEATAESVAALVSAELPEEGEPFESVLEACRSVFDASRHNGHPRMFGYVASPAAPAAAFADLLASALNANVTSWRSGPAATEVEQTVVRWLSEMVGYAREGERRGGLLTSGGSMANLVALYVAHRTHARRARPSPDPSRAGLWNAGPPLTVYASDQVHLSIAKAADLLGLGREHVRTAPADADFRLDVRALEELMEADTAAGLRPFCVVASAGTVNTGAVDPLDEVAALARRRGLWFHVDGAYGALARLDASKRELFKGLEGADSVSLDPHKWLYTPLGCGCLLTRDPGLARAAFSGTEEDYIRVYGRGGEEDPEAFAFWDYGVELSRPFRALKVWAMLRHYGRARLAAAVADDCALAAYMGERVSASDGFELLAPVTLGICCFRYVPERERRAREGAATREEREEVDARLDRLNEHVMYRVQRGGEAYLSNASLRGRFALRASITNFRTTRRDVDLTLDAVRRAARELEQGGEH